MTKKRPSIGIMLISLVLFFFIVLNYLSHNTVTGLLSVSSETGNHLYIDRYGLDIEGIDRDGVTYFCLPSYCDLDTVIQADDSNTILLDDNSLLKDPKSGTIQDIYVKTAQGDITPWRICFMVSANLDTLFLTLPNYNAEDIDHDKLRPASITMVSPTGHVSFHEENAMIKGRGNGSWDYPDKKPYEFRLNNKQSLCNMSASKRWTLLANQDYPGMINKLAFDLSEKLGMEYTPESEFVDLYANGRYLGNYLLCKEPHIGPSDLPIRDLEELNKPFFDPDNKYDTLTSKGYLYGSLPSDYSGGYLLEKNFSHYYDEKNTGFKTPYNYYTIKSPDNACKEEIEYISDYITSTDKRIRSAGPDQLDDLDLFSFVRWYLIEEFFFNDDAEIASRFFYKRDNSDILYAGPIWDMDSSIGADTEIYGEYFLNYNNSIMNTDGYIPQEDMESKNPLIWDRLLFDNPHYKEYLSETFSSNIPLFEEIINTTIDSYYNKIKASILMDRAIRGLGAAGHATVGHYSSYDDDIRYVKFFLQNRLHFLADLLDYDGDIPDVVQGNGTVHSITFLLPDGQVRAFQINDNESLPSNLLPEYDTIKYKGWINQNTSDPFSIYLPVYEDATYILPPLEE